MGELPRKQKRKPKMCNAQQQSPPQNTAWQGVYPDLSALNELFSTQQATAANVGQPSPWIGFLASLGLQPISGGQTPQQQQARPEQEPSAPPAPEKYRRMREQNNRASQACRAKRKRKLAEEEQELTTLQEKNIHLQAVFKSMQE